MNKLIHIFIISGLLFSCFAQADSKLIVIFDSGDTLPISPYLPEPLKPEPQKGNPIPHKRSVMKFPITTPSMQPGVVKSTPKALSQLHRPLFIVGTDDFSKRWLRERGEQLRQLNAVGLIVEAKDETAVKEIIKLTTGLQVVPASAESFANQLGLTHYPVLLSKDGWEQ